VSFMWFPEDDNCFKLKQHGRFIDDAGQPTTKSKKSSPRLDFQDTGGAKEAGEGLCCLIDPERKLDSTFGPRHPLVILAFDEAHVLTNNPRETEYYDIFIELRRVLRSIAKEPIFSLFLTTAGSFQRFSPDLRSDPSSRITRENPTLHPISEISFDTLAYSAKENEVSLEQVTKIDWIARLGRPLCVDCTYPCKSG
jgi:hypothetical protein